MSNQRIPEQNIQAFLSVSAEYLNVSAEEPDPDYDLESLNLDMEMQFSHVFSQTCSEGCACHA